MCQINDLLQICTNHANAQQIIPIYYKYQTQGGKIDLIKSYTDFTEAEVQHILRLYTKQNHSFSFLTKDGELICIYSQGAEKETIHNPHLDGVQSNQPYIQQSETCTSMV